MDLIVSWNFDELNCAFAPFALRLDPYARATIIKYAILIVIKITIALHQPKAPRVGVAKG